MGVEVAWMTGRHEEKQVVGDSYETISRLAISRWPKLTETVCLRFVDVCGDAVFNQAQLPFLIAELQAEVAFQEAAKDREHIEKVIRLVQVAAGRTHTYIAFLGD
jgi:hypothetical protein